MFVNRRDQREIFDQAFHVYWRNPRLLEKMMEMLLPQVGMPASEDERKQLSRRLQEALQALDRNTRLQPMSPFGWYQMARVHVDLQQPEEARAVIRHLKGFEPKVAAQLERETGLIVGQASA